MWDVWDWLRLEGSTYMSLLGPDCRPVVLCCCMQTCQTVCMAAQLDWLDALKGGRGLPRCRPRNKTLDQQVTASRQQAASRMLLTFHQAPKTCQSGHSPTAVLLPQAVSCIPRQVQGVTCNAFTRPAMAPGCSFSCCHKLKRQPAYRPVRLAMPLRHLLQAISATPSTQADMWCILAAPSQPSQEVLPLPLCSQNT